MKKLRTIFSPRKLIVILTIFVVAITLPVINEPAMSETQAIVTKMAIDREGYDKVKVAISIITPAKEPQLTNEIVYIGTGVTLTKAIDALSLYLGKNIGFAQCQVVAFGEGACEQGVMQLLDYLTRTKRVGRNAMLVSFSGDIKDFMDAVEKLNSKNALQINKVMNYDRRYLLMDMSSIESFYAGYFSDVSLGYMTKIQLLKTKVDNSLEVPTDSAEKEGSGSEEEKKYILNDGTTIVFKEGIKYFELSPDDLFKLKMFLTSEHYGTIIIKNFSDDFYENDTVVLNMQEKDIKKYAKFIDGKPVYKSCIEITVLVEEIIEGVPTKKLIKQSQEFLTKGLIEEIKTQMEEKMQDIVDLCRNYKFDLLEVHKNFNRFHYKKWKKLINEVGMENYLDEVKFEFQVKVANES